MSVNPCVLLIRLVRSVVAGFLSSVVVTDFPVRFIVASVPVRIVIATVRRRIVVTTLVACKCFLRCACAVFAVAMETFAPFLGRSRKILVLQQEHAKQCDACTRSHALHNATHSGLICKHEHRTPSHTYTTTPHTDRKHTQIQTTHNSTPCTHTNSRRKTTARCKHGREAYENE